LPTRTEWEEIVELCRDNGAYLFSDEMYRLLEADPVSRLTSAVDAYEKAITLSGTAFKHTVPSHIMTPRCTAIPAGCSLDFGKERIVSCGWQG